MSDTHESDPLPPNAPWWAAAVRSTAMTFGIPTLLLGFYFAQNAGWIPNPVADELQELKGVVLQHSASMKELVEEVKEHARERQMRCVLRAKDEAEKRACFPAIKEEH